MTLAIVVLGIMVALYFLWHGSIGHHHSEGEHIVASNGKGMPVSVETSGALGNDLTSRVRIEVYQIHFDLATDPNNPNLRLALHLHNRTRQELIVEKINWEVVVWVKKKFAIRGAYTKPFLLLSQNSLNHLTIQEEVDHVEAKYVTQTNEGFSFNCYVEGTVVGKIGNEVFQDRFLSLSVPCLVDEDTSAITRSLSIEPSHIDPLTGLLNRRFLSDYFQFIVDSLKSEQQLSFIMFDIDDFKKINDEYGHLIGDDAVKFVAAKMREAIGSRGLSIRYGGDEFSAILKDCGAEESKILTENFRSLVSMYEFKVLENKLKLTISAGIATVSNKVDHIVLIQRADDMLRVSKQCGKNRISESLVA